MTTRVPVKSILKTQPKSQQEATLPLDQEKLDRDRHNYNLALQHAHRIQDQKDWDARILKAIEVLVDYPSTTPFTAEEANNFVTLVQPFQPSDLDALVEERVVNDRCGYALCAKPPRSATLGKDAEWRAGKAGKDFCSLNCAKKSAYVKAQLSEVPASEREPGVQPRVELHEDDRPATPDQSAGVGLAAARRQQVSVAKREGDDELAVERGEQVTSFRPKQVMSDRIVEKAKTTFKPLSSVHGATVSHTAIEGYEPKERTRFVRGALNDSDDSDVEDEEADALGEDDDDDD
ncbi:hypothetical protein LTR53_007268 [Teratosphaeriaceae sp. CCFEE 6253]|nr:hypothetical protein LTR53_007268 [Teratosphaeriaceae sp. CCFEE 6253]